MKLRPPWDGSAVGQSSVSLTVGRRRVWRCRTRCPPCLPWWWCIWNHWCVPPESPTTHAHIHTHTHTYIHMHTDIHTATDSNATGRQLTNHLNIHSTIMNKLNLIGFLYLQTHLSTRCKLATQLPILTIQLCYVWWLLWLILIQLR